MKTAPTALQGYATPPYACSYLPLREARSRVAVMPPNQVQTGYDALIAQGFRRSGHYVYAPHCQDCQACTAMRLPVAQFLPTRSQKRAATALKSLQISLLPLHFDAEHFALYQRYQAQRHADDAAPSQPEPAEERHAYEQFLLRSHVQSELLAFRNASGTLVAVSMIDWVSTGLSAVYTFYEPTAKGSLGTSAIMQMVQLAQDAGLPYVYLGYWIAQSPKMAYKSKFQPAQVYLDREWLPFGAFVNSD